MTKNNFSPVERYIFPMDTNIVWYYIPGYNGYEISNSGVLRSMKHYKKYPFGLLVKPKEVEDITEVFNTNQEFTYEISDNNNNRVVVKRSELWKLAKENEHHVSGYPRYTYMNDFKSRNRKELVHKKDNINGEEEYVPKFYKEGD